MSNIKMEESLLIVKIKIMNTLTVSKNISSPYQSVRKEMYREEVDRCLGTYQLSLQVEEDLQSIALLKHVSGLVAFLCTVRDQNSGKILSQGRGFAVLNRMNKFVERTVRVSFNAAIIDSIVRATKSLDTLASPQIAEITTKPVEIGKENKSDEDCITVKQKELLQSLIIERVESPMERERWLQEAESCSKTEAAEIISNFLTASRR